MTPMGNKKEKKPEAEPKVKLYRLKINVEIEATSLDEARKLAQDQVKLLGREKIDGSVERIVRGKYSSRADRLSEAESSLSDAKGVVEELKDEIEQWMEGLPENLQGSEKYSALEECVSALEDLHSNLEEAESNFGSVEFPGMY